MASGINTHPNSGTTTAGVARLLQAERAGVEVRVDSEVLRQALEADG